MITVLSKLANNVAAIISGKTSEFTNVAPGAEVRASTMTPVLSLIVAILAIIIVLLAGKWLWNNIAVKYIAILRPVPSIWHLLGLMLIIDLVLPNCGC